MAVKLSKAARRALKRGRLKATATLTLRDARGRTATGKAALKLKARARPRAARRPSRLRESLRRGDSVASQAAGGRGDLRSPRG